MNWKLASHRTRRATIDAQEYDLKRYTRLLGYDTAARIVEAQEALTDGIGAIAYYAAARDGKRVSDKEWKGLK